MDVVLVTLNCAKQHISIAAAQDLIETALDKSRAPDALLIALQETAPIMDSMLGDISGYTASIELAVSAATKSLYGSAIGGLPALEYIADSRCGGTCLLLFSRHVLEPPIEAQISTGYGWSSLKGAAALKFELPGKMIVKAVSCHLPAGEGEAATKGRNQAISLIFGGLDFGNGEQLVTNTSNEHIFILGDLNYRGLKASDVDVEENLMTQTDVNASELSQSIRDSLTEERAKSDFFGGLEEAEIKFPPTYKYFSESSTLNWKRVPSWCDRILFSQQGCTPGVYDSFMSFEESDHKPVFLRTTLFDCEPPSYWPEATQCPDYAKKLTPAVDVGVGLAMFLGTKKLGRTALALIVISILYMLL